MGVDADPLAAGEAQPAGFIDRIDLKVENSKVGRYFHMAERKTRLSREVRAGIVTFLTACYILAVNSAILADTGGPCTDKNCTGFGADKGPGCRFMNNPGYERCVAQVRRSLVTATAATAAMSSFLMGAIANVPFAIMPGMGVNAYFAYTVVGYRGTGLISYEQALAAVFIEGWIFVLLSISGLRSGALTLVPRATMLATAGGIGLFLAFIGLQKSEGLGVVVADGATLVSLGGCPRQNQVHFFTPKTPDVPESICKVDFATQKIELDLGAPSPNYMCKGGRLHSPAMWLGIAGFGVIVVLMARHVNGAIMLGILFTTFISWIPNHGASYLGEGSQIAGGEQRLRDFKEVVSVPNAQKTSLTWSFSAFSNSQLWVALITFLYLDFLDATGTMYSMASMINKDLPGFINPRDKSFPRSIYAFTLDGIGIVIGSLLGCAPLTVCLESAAGIREGGRTGVTAIVAGFCFFLSMFFTPLIVSIPPYATGPALIIVGALMMESVVDIDWGDIKEAVPAFLTMAIMPLTYSVAYGVIAGLVAHIVIQSIMLIMDIIGALFKKQPVKEVLLNYCPEILRHRFTKARPLKSVAALTGEQVDDEHARHFDEVARRAYSSGKDDANLYRPNGGDELPTSAPPPPPAEGPSNGVPK